MITTADFKRSAKLVSAGIILKTEFYYNKKTGSRHPAIDLPRGIKDFDKIYVPAPADNEIDDILPASFKTGKNVFQLTTIKEKSGYKASYVCRGYPVDEELYICQAISGADAKTDLAIKLQKDDKLRK